jgi:hypothetical protein
MKNKTLQRYLLTLTILGLTVGCTHTKFTGGNWTMDRTTVLQKVEIGDVSVSTNGTASLKGYQNDGAQQITLQLLQALLQGTLKVAVVP